MFSSKVYATTGRKELQITTDGFAPYRSAIVNTLEDCVDFAQLIKVYRAPSEGEGRYSPADIAATEVVPVIGNPDPKRICTSIVERQNLTIRMQMRRLTRLTNAFSKKWENLWAAYCLHFAHYRVVGQSATIYDYTPSQAMVVELHNHYRTALMNAKYYARVLDRWKFWNTVADIVTAIIATSAFGGLAIWKSDIGKNAFSFALGFSAIISAIRPVLRVSDKIDRYSKLNYGYLEIFYRIQALVADMRSSGHITEEHRQKTAEVVDRFRALELEGDAYQSHEKLRTIQDEIERTLPADQLWLPQE